MTVYYTRIIHNLFFLGPVATLQGATATEKEMAHERA